jgi:3-hydroxybutyryl-CoA dehydrogenase
MIKKIGVIGTGTMGSEIALVGAKQGFEVMMVDISQEVIKKARQKIEKFLAKDVKKGGISKEEEYKAISRIKGTTSLEKIASCDVVIEAVSEKEQLKKELFKKLDSLCPKEVIFASNTSAISITDLASVTQRADKIIGMHFMNPVRIIKLVEVVRGLNTSDHTVQVINELAKALKKVPVEVQDFPGFISNRLLIPMINEAAYCLMEDVATKESIDQIMKLGMNHPMGPFELADLIGIDVCLYIMEELYQGFADPKYRPCPLLRKIVDAGCLGRKTGRGFYKYKEE